MNIMDITEDLIFVKDNLRTLESKFKSNPHFFYNESDLQSELFSQLIVKYNNKEQIKTTRVWGTNEPKTVKNVYTRRLHSELLLPEGRIDLAILDLNNIVFAVNSKGHFGYIQIEPGDHIFIEIKSSRTNRSSISSSKRWLNLIKDDIKKLSHYNHPCFLLCFDFNVNTYLDDSMLSKIEQSIATNLKLFYFTNIEADNYLKDV